MEHLKSVFLGASGVILFVLVSISLYALVAAFIYGGVWLGSNVLGWLTAAILLLLLFNVFVLLPLSAFSKTQGISGRLMFLSSWAFGIYVWLYSVVFAYYAWGFLAVFIGLALLGVGVIPIALVAAAIQGLWSPFFEVLTLTVATFGFQIFGRHLGDLHERRRYAS